MNPLILPPTVRTHTACTLACSRVTVYRFDELDAEISGNKIFKLRPYLQAAIGAGANTIVTYGGPYSNHLLATAKAAQLLGLQCTLYVRGYASVPDTPTLIQCKNRGAQIAFLGRTHFAEQAWKQGLDLSGAYHIPMGGFGLLGIEGAGDMGKYLLPQTTHVVLAAGTGTMAAGMALARPDVQVMAIDVTGDDGVPARIEAILGNTVTNLSWHHAYRFGGYAKTNPYLQALMAETLHTQGLPLDFVYTAKAFAALMQAHNHLPFLANDVVAFVHSGGLRGNAGTVPAL